MAAAKAEGFDLTKDEADAYMAELADFELDDATLKQAAGGTPPGIMPGKTACGDKGKSKW